jgi:hypothetical protein
MGESVVSSIWVSPFFFFALFFLIFDLFFSDSRR